MDFYTSLDSLEAVEDTCKTVKTDQTERMGSLTDQTVQIYRLISLCWLHNSYCRFRSILAQIS